MSVERVASGRILELNGIMLDSVRGLDRLRRRICPCESSRYFPRKPHRHTGALLLEPNFGASA